MKEEIVEKIGVKALALLETMAIKLGVTVEHIWEILVKQCYVESAISLFWVIISTVAIIWCIKWLSNADYAATRNEDGSFFFGINIMVKIIIIIKSVIILSEGVSDVAQVLNPEYFAYEEIIRIINITGK